MPLVRARVPSAHLTVVAGPEPELYFDAPVPEGVTRLSFVRDVKPLYVTANVVIVPTKVERSALQNAASIASLLLTTDAIISEIKEDKPEPAGAPGGGMY